MLEPKTSKVIVWKARCCLRGTVIVKTCLRVQLSVVRSVYKGDTPDRLCNNMSGIISLVLRSSIQAVRDSLVSNPKVLSVTADKKHAR